MANIDTETSGLSDLIPRDGSGATVSEEVTHPDRTSSTPAVPEKPSEFANPDAATNESPSASSESSSVARPTINTAVSSASSNSTVITPHPKKFSAVNINKKFLQKNSASPITSGLASANSPSLKSGSPAHPVPRPAAQLPASHSRLITTKLTATPLLSTTTGPGWSRPSSAAPSPSPVNPTGPSAASAPAAPQLPHVGKVIQPQHRVALSGLKNEGSGKPVWGNIKNEVSPPNLRAQNDFPTAAEVASVNTSVRNAKLLDAKEAAESAAADKQARSVEADTFRGIHLDPNAHHWDEMEEDDDNFLDGVIEFGDGRQYKIQPADALGGQPESTQDDTTAPEGETPAVPVSKEERFADDFDRSWPRSKTSPSLPHREPPPRAQPHPMPSSPSTSQAQSPQDAAAARVLFNERSNRLEPYSNNAHPRPGPHPMNRRGSHADSAMSPNESRGGRDLPPHTQPSGVQLLQKPGSSPIEGPTRQGPFGPIASGAATAYNKDRPREPRRPYPPAQQDSGWSKDHLGPPTSPGEGRGRRLSNMGPPPLPLSLDRSKDTGRQLPPHLSPMLPHSPMLSRRIPSREPHIRPPSTVPSDAPSSRRPSFVHPVSQSPTLSHASLASDHPPQHPPQLVVPSPENVEKMHKDAMQQSAERARLRRQQEEEEREKQKERARLKAAELEEKLKAEAAPQSPLTAKPSESEVSKFLEDAIKEPISQAAPSSIKPALHRPPSLRPVSRQMPQPGGPAGDAESWRSKANAPAPPAARQIHVRPPPSATAPKPPPPVLHSIESLVVQPDEDLEVVDFSDMGKFVGVPEPAAEGQTPRPPRPVAADFFGDAPPAPEHPVSKSDTGPWRRPQSRDFDRDSFAPGSDFKRRPDSAVAPPPDAGSQVVSGPTDVSLSSPGKERRMSSSSQSVTGSSHAASVNIAQQRPARNAPAYREATMSALDDVMSRIKGALTDMQEVPKDISHPLSEAQSQPAAPPTVAVTPAPSTVPPGLSKWVPPALRPRSHDFDHQPLEVFDVTVPEPPRSPKPAWNTFSVRLPTVSAALEPLSQKQLNMFMFKGGVRWDILSFDPPVEGMLRREFSLNDVLFGKPQPKRASTVALPRRRTVAAVPSALNVPSSLKAHSPTSPIPKAPATGAFGRPSGANDTSTWRKSTAPLATVPDSELDTVSRSPPPSLTHEKPTSPSPEDLASARSRSQPKMPAGSAVAFYRGSRIDATDSALNPPSVNFTVTSELEEAQSKSKAGSPATKAGRALTGTDSRVMLSAGEVKSQPVSPELLPALVQSKAGSKSSEDSTDQVPITPPQTTNSTWTKSPLSFKDSPARAPDPEHLKAVWSQASNKSRVHSVNSLEAIADDLTGLPFTLQDVKSDDGETPPPSSSVVASRMSLHEVTRAFQQVPSSSSSSNATTQRSTPLSPPPSNGTVTRPPTFAYPVPSPNPNMRPQYAGYPSPMSHSPSPTMIYPSPVPGRMSVNGHSPMYSAPPLWVPLPPSSTQQHPGMMRPMASPYPGQMMPYPSPGAGPSMYVQHHQPNMQSPGPQQPGAGQGRGRGMMPPMSPAMQHAAAHSPMYHGSPVLMHASPMHGHPYMSPVPAGRGQLRNDQSSPSTIQHAHSPHPHPGYTPVPQTSFMRPNW